VSNVMMSTPGWVDDDEKEASGGFMGISFPLFLLVALFIGNTANDRLGMCLVVGLATGSLASFLIMNV